MSALTNLRLSPTETPKFTPNPPVPSCSGKMVEALHSYMPPGEHGQRWRRGRAPASAAALATLFEVHPLVIQHLVKRWEFLAFYLYVLYIRIMI